MHDFEKNEGVFVDEAFVSDLVAKVEKIIKEAHDNTFDAEFGSYVGHCGAEQGRRAETAAKKAVSAIRP